MSGEGAAPPLSFASSQTTQSPASTTAGTPPLPPSPALRAVAAPPTEADTASMLASLGLSGRSLAGSAATAAAAAGKTGDPSQVSVGTWESLPSRRLVETPAGAPQQYDAPTPRAMHTMVAWGDSVFIFGGYDGSRRLSEFYEYSFQTKCWFPVKGRGIPPSPRDRHAATVAGNSMYVFGGHDGSQRLSDTHVFDFAASRWLTVSGGVSQPTARHSHCMTSHKPSAGGPERVYLFGGFDGAYRNDLHILDLSAHEWSRVATSGHGPTPRYRSSLVSCADHLVVFGGHDGTRHLNDLYCFNPETSVWTRVYASGLTPIPRDSHTAVVYNESVVVFGGSSGSAMNDLHELVLSTARDGADGLLKITHSTWVPLFPGGIVPHPRFCHSAVMYGSSKVVLFGGFDGITRSSDVFQLNLNVGRLGVRVDVPQSSLVSDLGQLVNNPEGADVAFLAEGTRVPGHRLLLRRIPYFAELFRSAPTQTEFPIENVPLATFLNVLLYAYTDDCDFAHNSVVSLFQAADRFNVERLKLMCQNAMLDVLDASNASSLLARADKYNAAHMRALAFNYIVAHFDEVSVTPDFEEMGRTRVDLVFEILKRRGATKVKA